MDDREIDGWRDGWREAVRHREMRSDLLLSLSGRPMITTRRIAWRDALGREMLAMPAHARVTVAALPFSPLGRVWVDGVRMPGDVEIGLNFREPTAREEGDRHDAEAA